jgi:hypothetical protein
MNTKAASPMHQPPTWIAKIMLSDLKMGWRLLMPGMGKRMLSSKLLFLKADWLLTILLKFTY